MSQFFDIAINAFKVFIFPGLSEGYILKAFFALNKSSHERCIGVLIMLMSLTLALFCNYKIICFLRQIFPQNKINKGNLSKISLAEKNINFINFLMTPIVYLAPTSVSFLSVITFLIKFDQKKNLCAWSVVWVLLSGLKLLLS